MATFFNQATLSYNGRLMNSNITSGEIINSLDATKTAVSSNYSENGTVVYAINIVNSGATTISDLGITDNLGAYNRGNITVYPLEYLEGSVKYFINGVAATPPSVISGPPLQFSDINIPASSSALILYEARTNEFAPYLPNSSIVNNATLSGDGIDAIEMSSEVFVRNTTDLTISKAVCPATVTEDGLLNYTFIIQNSGNIPAVATDNVIVTDTFNPILSSISVTYNSERWVEGENYTYSETTGDFSTLPGQITVPAATYTQNDESGALTVTPGVAVISVSGTV